MLTCAESQLLSELNNNGIAETFDFEIARIYTSITLSYADLAMWLIERRD